jgi:hypothetical protein
VLTEHGCVVIENAFFKTAAESMQKAFEWAVRTSAEDTAIGSSSSDDRLQQAISVRAGGQVGAKPADCTALYHGAGETVPLSHNPFTSAVNVARDCIPLALQRAVQSLCFGQWLGRLVNPPGNEFFSGDFPAGLLPPQRGTGEYQVYAVVEEGGRRLCFVPGSHRIADLRNINLSAGVAARSACADSWGTVVVLKARTVRFESHVKPACAGRLHRVIDTCLEEGAASKYLRIDVALCRDRMSWSQDSAVVEYLSEVYHLSRQQSHSKETRHSLHKACDIEEILRPLHASRKRRR